MKSYELVQHPQIGGLSVFFDTVDYRTPHFHPEWELVYPLQALQIQCGQQLYRVQPGELFLLSPHTTHEYCMVETSCTFLCIQVGPKLFSASFPAMDRIALEDLFPGRYLPEAEYAALKKRLLAIAEAYISQRPNYELFCIGQIGLVLYDLFSAMPTHMLSSEEILIRDKRNARLTRLLAFVDQYYMHKIRLSDFAEQGKRTLSYMASFVHEALNQSFHIETVNGLPVFLRHIVDGSQHGQG